MSPTTPMHEESDPADSPADPADEPTVVAVVRLGSAVGSKSEQDALDQLEEDLDQTLVDAGEGAGEFEGAELGNCECHLFFGSDDPERTVALVRPVLAQSRFREGATFRIRAVDPDGVRRTRTEDL